MTGPTPMAPEGRCDVCGRPVDEGDEPGTVQISPGLWADVCSEGCTEEALRFGAGEPTEQDVRHTEVQYRGSIGDCAP